MSDIISGLITGASNLAGAKIAANSQRKAGKLAAQVQRETNAMQVNLANTAHQREIADLKAAGLNPLLSGTGGRGSETPTLQAPTQEAEGEAAAGKTWGNTMAVLPAAIMQWMTGQQQIDLNRATAEKTRAEADKINIEKNWISPSAESQINLQKQNIGESQSRIGMNAQSILESQQRVVESTAKTKEAQAQTATIEAMREPQVKHLLQQVAQSVQQTKTEEQRTRETTEAANYAKQLYGARASEAATIAAQAATYYKNYFTTEQSQLQDKRDLENQLLRDEHFQKVIANILENEYGRQISWSKIFSGLTQTGAAPAASKKNVTQLPY